MSTSVRGTIKSIESDHDYRGDERQVIEIELGDGNTVKAFDDTNQIDEEMAGKEHEMTLLARAARHLGKWNTDFIDNPYYCVISGEVVERNLEHGEHRAASIDFGDGEMIVSYQRGNSHAIEEGEELDVLADKIVLLELK